MFLEFELFGFRAVGLEMLVPIWSQKRPKKHVKLESLGASKH